MIKLIKTVLISLILTNVLCEKSTDNKNHKKRSYGHHHNHHVNTLVSEWSQPHVVPNYVHSSVLEPGTLVAEAPHVHPVGHDYHDHILGPQPHSHVIDPHHTQINGPQIHTNIGIQPHVQTIDTHHPVLTPGYIGSDVHTTVTKNIAVPVPVAVEKKIPFPVKIPIAIPVDRPIPYPVYKPYAVPIEKPVPIHIDRPIPYIIPQLNHAHIFRHYGHSHLHPTHLHAIKPFVSVW